MKFKDKIKSLLGFKKTDVDPEGQSSAARRAAAIGDTRVIVAGKVNNRATRRAADKAHGKRNAAKNVRMPWQILIQLRRAGLVQPGQKRIAPKVAWAFIRSQTKAGVA